MSWPISGNESRVWVESFELGTFDLGAILGRDSPLAERNAKSQKKIRRLLGFARSFAASPRRPFRKSILRDVIGVTEDNPADSWVIEPLGDARASLFALNIGVGVELRQIVRLPFKLAVTLAD